jgi:hypothetical protein
VTFATQFSTDLLRLATQTVTITPRSSINSYGEVLNAGSGTNYKAYVQKISASNRNASTDQAVIDYVAYIPSTTYSPSTDDLLTVGGIARVIVEADIRSDEFGQQCVVLALGEPRRN